MVQDRFPAGRFDAIRRHAERPQRLFNFGRQDQMINPLKKIGGCFLTHSPGQLAREAVALQERIHALAQKLFRAKRQGPIERIIHSDTIPDKT